MWYKFSGLGRCPSGQWEQTVNLSARAYAGSNPALPTTKPKKIRLRSSGVEHFFGKEEVTGSNLVGGSSLAYCVLLRARCLDFSKLTRHRCGGLRASLGTSKIANQYP